MNKREAGGGSPGKSQTNSPPATYQKNEKEKNIIMRKIKTKCHLCYEVSAGEEVPDFCPTCGTSLKDQGETQVKRAGAQLITGKVTEGWDGFLYLTNKRLFYYKVSKLGAGAAVAAAGGFVGGLIAGAVSASKQALVFSLEFDKIASAEVRKRGLLGKDLFINATTGESYKIQTSNVASWEAEINNVIQNV